MLSTNLHVEVTELSKHLPQIGFKIAMKYYRHQSFFENMIVLALQSIELPVLTLIAHFMFVV
jgi:hypothetical protein